MYQLFIDIYVYIHFFQGSNLRVTILLQLHIYNLYTNIYIYTCLALFPEQLHRHRRWVPIALWDFLQGWMGTTSPSWYGCLTMTEIFVVQVWIKSKVSVYSRTRLEVVVHSPWRAFQCFCCKDPSSCLRWWRRDRRRDHTGGATTNTTRSKKLFKKKRCSVKKRRCFGKMRCCHMLLNYNNAVQFQYYS